MKRFLLLLLLASQLFAHGVGFDLKSSESVQLVQFKYADGKPLTYCEILVYGPEDDEIEFQNGRTDRNGYFAFLPDKEGVWLVEIKDTQGHNATAQIVISEDKKGFSGELLKF